MMNGPQQDLIQQAMHAKDWQSRDLARETGISKKVAQDLLANRPVSWVLKRKMIIALGLHLEDFEDRPSLPISATLNQSACGGAKQKSNNSGNPILNSDFARVDLAKTFREDQAKIIHKMAVDNEKAMNEGKAVSCYQDGTFGGNLVVPFITDSKFFMFGGRDLSSYEIGNVVNFRSEHFIPKSEPIESIFFSEIKPILKDKPFKSKKSLEAAKGERCMKCRKEDGTIVSAHYTGEGQIGMGKGTGQKLSDIFSAFLCDECHSYFDQYKGVIIGGRNAGKTARQFDILARSNEFMRLIFKTLEKKFKDGIHT